MDVSTSAKLDSVYRRYVDEEGNAVSILQYLQDEFGYVPEDAVYAMAERTGIAPSMFFGIVTFYTQFHTKPRGANIITACCGTVCHVKGARRIISRIQDELRLKEDQDTTRDKLFTLEKVNCIGACSIAPVVVVNQKVHGMMSPEKMARELKKCRERTGA